MTVALVTGASSGIGKAIAKQLINDGLTVCVAARSYDKMEDLATLGAHRYRMDVTDEAEMEAVINEITAQHGPIDVLVNNAGFGLYGAVEDIPIEDARYQFEVNLFGLARLTQLVLPDMRERGSGKIVNISSMGGKIYTLLGAWYHASKHALEGWSDALRLEVAPHGIDVVLIEPGIINTGFGDVAAGPIRQRSGDGPYADLAHMAAAAIEGSYENGGGSSPDVVAKAVTKAIHAKRPKTRYVVGQMAAPLIFMRRLLPDRMFDFLVMRASA